MTATVRLVYTALVIVVRDLRKRRAIFATAPSPLWARALALTHGERGKDQSY